MLVSVCGRYFVFETACVERSISRLVDYGKVNTSLEETNLGYPEGSEKIVVGLSAGGKFGVTLTWLERRW